MNIAILLLAGSSVRMKNSPIPKQLCLVNNKPLFIYSALTLQNTSDIDEIILVTSEKCLKKVKEAVSKYQLTKVKDVILGGQSRQESVALALDYLKEKNIKDNDIVLIHDAARPLVNEKIIKDNILLCQRYDAVTTAINVEDTVIDNDGNYLDRSKILRLQTPQTFKFVLIYEAHQLAKENQLTVNDDSQLMDLVGHEVCYALGDKSNFKVTTDADLELLKKIIG